MGDKSDTTQQLSPVIEPIQHDPRGGLKFWCVQHQQLDSIFLSCFPLFVVISIALCPFCCSSIHPSYVHIEFNRALFWNSLRAIKDQGFRNMFKRLFNMISCPCISMHFLNVWPTFKADLNLCGCLTKSRSSWAAWLGLRTAIRLPTLAKNRIPMSSNPPHLLTISGNIGPGRHLRFRPVAPDDVCMSAAISASPFSHLASLLMVLKPTLYHIHHHTPRSGRLCNGFPFHIDSCLLAIIE